MKGKIIMLILMVLVILTIGSVGASQDFIQNETAVSDDLLMQNEIDDIQQKELTNESQAILSSEKQDGLDLQEIGNQDNLSAKAVENYDEENLQAVDNPDKEDLLTKTPAYLAKSNIWFQSSDLNIEDSNLWIINDNAKAFPKGSFIKIVANEKGSKYSAQHTMPIEELFPERGMENIHYYALLREFTDIQFKPYKKYNLKIYFVSASGKAHLIGKKNVKIKWSKKRWYYGDHNVYFFYRYLKNNPYGDFFRKVFKTHPNDKQKIKIIIYKKNGKFLENKKVRYKINNGKKYFYAKTNSRGLLIIPTPKKTSTYRYSVNALKGWFNFKVKVYHSVSIPKVTFKKSAKKIVIPLQLRKINGKFYKNQKITFKLDNKTYNIKTNKKGIAKVAVKKSVLKNLRIGQKVKLQAIYKNDTATKIVKVTK